MLRNNVLWILVLAGVRLIEGEESASKEKRIPEFILQFFNLSFEIRNKSYLFLESSHLARAISTKIDFARDLGRI